MSLYDSMNRVSSPTLAICEICSNFVDYDEKGNITCKAYPGGIPDDVNINSKEMMKRKCSEKYRFKEK